MFNPVHFVPASHKDAILAKKVECIIAAPHSKTTGTNHWCFYLKTGPDASVMIDCQPSYTVSSTVLTGGSKANVVISELECVISHDAQARFTLGVTPGLTVADVYNVLIQNGRHKYEFDSKGVGCRHWLSNQLDLLQQQQIITNAGEVTAAKAGILKLWPDETSLALDVGAYYQ